MRNEEENHWRRADLALACDKRYGKLKQLALDVGEGYRTVKLHKRTAEAFPQEKGIRMPFLSFYHHAVCAYSRNPAGWLRKAAEQKWSVRELKNEIKRVEGFRSTFMDGLLFEYNIWEPEPSRDPRYGDGDFHGNCSGTVAKQCLIRYTKEGELVLDPMAGSGTVPDACRDLKRQCRAFDIIPGKYAERGIEFGDARTLPVSEASVDFVFCHFPYWRMVRYSGRPEDLSNMSYPEFYEASRRVFQESMRVLKSGRYLACLIGDCRVDRKLYDLPSDFSVLGRQLGFELVDKIAKIITKERSKFFTYPKPKNGEVPPHRLGFETLLILQKVT